MSYPDYGIYLYGSSARGDSGRESDMDVLVVLKNGKASDVTPRSLQKKHGLSNTCADWSLYSLGRLQKMYRAGHLFAWHLFKEARFLAHGADFLASFDAPAPYGTFHDDVRSLLALLDEAEHELADSSENITFEAGLVYLSARNIAMSASYYSPNGLSFSSFAPFELGYSDNLFPVNKEFYQKLRSARLAGTRGFAAPMLRTDDVLETARKIRSWAEIEFQRIGSESCYEAHVC
ncbi:MAG: nucleotidyltransferase domain-containing protein [Candidatus Thiodiazotropha sp.]